MITHSMKIPKAVLVQMIIDKMNLSSKIDRVLFQYDADCEQLVMIYTTEVEF